MIRWNSISIIILFDFMKSIFNNFWRIRGSFSLSRYNNRHFWEAGSHAPLFVWLTKARRRVGLHSQTELRVKENTARNSSAVYCPCIGQQPITLSLLHGQRWLIKFSARKREIAELHHYPFFCYEVVIKSPQTSIFYFGT